MDAFTTLAAVVVPLDRAHVDTDAIIPKQFMKSIRRTGFGDNLFDDWRYLDHGEPGQDCSQRPRHADFVLNQPAFAGAQILLARENFGCGSSREHAVWALHDYGIRALVAPSFADIFFANCFKNGMLPIVLDAATIDRLFAAVAARPGTRWAIDLPAQTLTLEGPPPLAPMEPTAPMELLPPISFSVDPDHKHRLLNGLDSIGLTLAKADAIRAYESRRRALEPWLFN
ncbi:MAG: 3-isopropylmalate dehydratase small subunit [Microbacteriaceae bacterium]|nr:3-isopropylmalate dehydratase small subunit [Burkholderiaceae bacterium]